MIGTWWAGAWSTTTTASEGRKSRRTSSTSFSNFNITILVSKDINHFQYYIHLCGQHFCGWIEATLKLSMQHLTPYTLEMWNMGLGLCFEHIVMFHRLSIVL